ncbi:lamin tail domain-containing protein [Myxococcus sp. CA039A]|uniref:lamin tail domain-containing protein n=1 Tax=Myxococcus sp. CA039A TaxID=2741737 RepID=UPI0020C6ED9E|nr:lamin tail domain-containing protein [Myxococcus sp. CA039A]
MSLIRAAGALVVLAFLSACSGSRHDDPGGGPKLPTSELTDTTVGATYEVHLTATGGTAPLSYTLETEVPPGFSFYSADGKLTGPASASGEFSLRVSVRDVEKSVDTRTYSLKVWPAPVLSAVAPSAAFTGNGYTHTFSVAGGRPPLTFSVAEGSLPSGLSLTQDGEVTGVAELAGTKTFTLRVQDASGVKAEGRFSLEVKPGTGIPDGGPSTSFPLAVGNWNIEWFGSPTEDPADDALQLANVQSVIGDAGVDVWGLGEMVNTAQFNTLKDQLPGYEGFLSNDSTVTLGPTYYSFNEQKVGLLYKTGLVEVRQAQIVLSEYENDFAGRPPLRVDLRITRGVSSVDLTVLVLHMKAMTGADDYARRLAAGQHLKDYLDFNLPTQKVMVVGDWNDDVDGSTTTNPSTGGKFDTPYRDFVDDTVRYAFVTQAMSLQGVASTVSFSTFIDHQLVSNEMLAHYVSGSAAVLRPNIPSYGSTTSDHYPIISRYNFGEVPEHTVKLTAPNGGESLSAGVAFDITWTSAGVNTVRLQYSLDDGLTWSNIVASVAAMPATYTWTVPAVESSTARVRISDAQDGTLADVSDNVFRLNRPLPTLFINEYLPHPNNISGTGPVDFDKMFVEIRNTGTTAVDLGGYSIHDEESRRGDKPARHVFPGGTMLQPGTVFTVYSGASAVPSGVPNVAYANGGDGLRFNRGVNTDSSGDTAFLVRPDGSEQDKGQYRDAFQGVSYNRSPDGSAAGSWVLHNTLSSSTASPRTRVDGSAF